MNKTATFVKSKSNHPDAKDWVVKDSHGFGVGLISSMFHWSQLGEYFAPLTQADTDAIKIVMHKSYDIMGTRYTVSAPAEVWERGKEAMKAYADNNF